MIELIMSIGFCIDFSAHIVHSFIANSGRGSRNKRALKAILHVGMPILNSAVSTVIGVMLLAFCKSYIFITFCKSMLIIMTLGVLNSLLFLPVLLSLVGPHWPRHYELNELTAAAGAVSLPPSQASVNAEQKQSNGGVFKMKTIENVEEEAVNDETVAGQRINL
jgi:multidrug efflux pump subunit AcrB